MSLQQTPPSPDSSAPLPGGGLQPAPVYRQDEFVRQPTSWTLPMQRAVGVYLVVSTILAFAIFLATEHELRQVLHDQLVKRLSTTSSKVYTPAEINTLTGQSMTVVLVSSGFFGIIAIGIGALTLARRATALLLVDMILTGFGILGLLSGLTSLASASGVPLQSGFSVLESVVATALFLWMLIGLLKYGPWAEKKVPATL